MVSPSVYDHVQPIDTDYLNGIYRVVGTPNGTVTLLRVADADGRRVSSGELVTVTADELDGFAPAENPDGNRPLETVIALKLKLIYWSGRVTVQHFVEHPLPTAVAVTLLLTVFFGDHILWIPEIMYSGFILAGSLSLAYIGSGRL